MAAESVGVKTASRTEIIEAFRAVPTGNISDAMDALGMARGVIHGLKPLSLTQPRTAGFAFTVKQMPRHHEAVGEKLAKHAQVIDELSSAGDVLVIDVGGRLDICSGGALLALRAKLRGLAGWIVNGCVRDVQEIIELGFPVHCCGTSPIKSSPALETVGLNVAVEIAGVQIKSGDLIVADDTGMVVVPASKASAVLEKALQIQKTEVKVAEFLRAGLNFRDARKRSEG
jgi:regulator of RNase E activity RraA